MSQSEIVVSTDGSALGNPNGPMGWAWADHQGEGADAGGATNGTNQIGELCAVLQALRAHRGATPLTIQTDSQYAINCSTKWVHGWKKKGWKNAAGKPVKNRQLIEAIDREISQRPGPVKFFWVKGHAGDRFNEKVDDLARGFATDVRSGDKRSYLPIEGWQSLLASPYTKGLKISEEVRLQLKGQHVNPAQSDALYNHGAPEMAEEEQPSPLAALALFDSPGDDIEGDAVNQTQVMEPIRDLMPGAEEASESSPSQERAQSIPPVPAPPSPQNTAQASDEDEFEEAAETAEDEPFVEAEESEERSPQGSAQGSAQDDEDDAQSSRGLVATGDLIITPPPSRSPYFAGKDLHISGTISFSADIDQEGRVHIKGVPFRLHSIDVREEGEE
ncbi:ribonuclease H [Bombiscardovia apis]|uniref:ribonuclease H n=1 Tax=Bombiscardovia apis TaxID=2932182 RepID=A0ABN6SIH4_9BIFI|nr:ribonuclease H [Bombiscardovia apis]BDR55113.1 ribonuclease H [Bombiscardovia apis]